MEYNIVDSYNRMVYKKRMKMAQAQNVGGRTYDEREGVFWHCGSSGDDTSMNLLPSHLGRNRETVAVES